MAYLQSNPQQRALPPHFDMYPTSQSPAAAGPSSQPTLALVDPAIAAAGPGALPPGTDEDDGSEENIFRDMTFEDVLDELAGRFLVNLPEEENSSLRLYWQAEQAHWFYEDYLRPLNPLLPALSQRQFTHLILASSPVHAAAEIDYDAVWQEYCAYKKMVPCCGGILINQSGDKALMVRGWKSNAGWCFPRGKINSEESEVACAIREVEEETGFDLDGLVNPTDFIKTQINAQEVTMFIVKDIDENTVFETQTRKEIGAIEWVPLVDLPTWTHKKGPKRTAAKGQKRFYNVTPFVGPLKKWLQKRGINPHPRKKAAAAAGGADAVPVHGRHRELQPFSFDAGPQTELDHLFAKFIQKDDNVDRLESDRARSLDQLFSSLYVVPADGSAPTYPQETEEQRKEDDALARLLGGIGAPPAQQQQPAHAQPAAAPVVDAKQTKLLAMLNPAKQQAVAPPSPPRSTHQNALLSMLSPPGSGAPASASSTLSSADTEEERRNRQRGALLESLFPINTSAPMTPPAPGHLRPQSASLSGMISPMPPMPPSQSWQTPTTASPSRGMGTPPMQQQRQYAQPNPPQVAIQPPPGQQQQQQPYPTAPQQQPPYPVQQQNLSPNFSPPQALASPPQPYGQSPPGPATEHQRALLGTLFSGPRGGPGPNGSAPPQMGGQVGPPPGGFGQPGPPGPPSMPLPFNGGHPGQPGHGRQVPPPGQGYPPQQPNPFFAGGPPPGPGGMGYPPKPPGMMPRGPSGGFGGPQGYAPGLPPGMVHGGFPPQLHPQQQLQQPPPPGQQQHHQQQQQQQQQLQQQHAQQQAQQSLQPLPPLPPQTAQKLVSPSAVHQPVPRPPVGHELLGLINGR